MSEIQSIPLEDVSDSTETVAAAPNEPAPSLVSVEEPSTLEEEEQEDFSPEALESPPSQLHVIRKQLRQENDLERPEFPGALLSSLFYGVCAGLLSAFAFQKVWWVALIFGAGSSVGVFLLWLVISVAIPRFSRRFSLSWWMSIGLSGGFSWWFFASAWAALSLSLCGAASYAWLYAFLRRSQKREWEYLGLPDALCKQIIKMPEALPTELEMLLDESLQQFSELKELMEEELLPASGLNWDDVSRDAEQLLLDQFQKAERLAEMQQWKEEHNKDNQKMARLNQQECERMKESTQALRALVLSLEQQLAAPETTLEELQEHVDYLHLLSKSKQSLPSVPPSS